MFSSAVTTSQQALASVFVHISDETRSKIADALYQWLVNSRKRPFPGVSPADQEAMMQEKLKVWKDAIVRLSKSIAVDLKGKNFSISTESGEDDKTLTLLSRGSSWFEPCTNFVQIVVHQILPSR